MHAFFFYAFLLVFSFCASETSSVHPNLRYWEWINGSADFKESMLEHLSNSKSFVGIFVEYLMRKDHVIAFHVERLNFHGMD